MSTINDLTLGQIRELQATLLGTPAIGNASDSPYAVGKNYLIRTVTMALTGRIVRVGPQELVITDAAWIADTGRYAAAIVSCNFAEVEPYPDGAEVIVGRGAVVDAVQIATLPRTVK
jgi:hypothetical protein